MAQSAQVGEELKFNNIPLRSIMSPDIVEHLIREQRVDTLVKMMMTDKSTRDFIVSCLHDIDKPDALSDFLLHQALKYGPGVQGLGYFIDNILRCNPGTAFAANSFYMTPLHISVQRNIHSPSTIKAIFNANRDAVRVQSNVSHVPAEVARNRGYSSEIVELLTVADTAQGDVRTWHDIQTELHEGTFMDTLDVRTGYVLHRAVCQPEHVVPDELVLAIVHADPRVCFWSTDGRLNALHMALMHRRSPKIITALFEANRFAAVVRVRCGDDMLSAVSYAVRSDYDLNIVRLMLSVPGYKNEIDAIKAGMKYNKTFEKLEELRTLNRESVDFVASGRALRYAKQKQCGDSVMRFIICSY